MAAPVLKTGNFYSSLQKTYRLLQPCHRRSAFVWNAIDCSFKNVVVKHADHALLLRERDVLTQLGSKAGVRRLIDTISSPPLIVLESFQDDLRSLCLRRRLAEQEMQIVAQRVCQALAAAHEQNIVHTDVKPQNILVTGFDVLETGTLSAAKKLVPSMLMKEKEGIHQEQSAVLADWGEASSPANHSISPPSFRAPEVWLGWPWNPKADIWSFGIVVASMLLQRGREVLSVFDGANENAKITRSDALMEMHLMFGPLPERMIPLGEESRFAEKPSAPGNAILPWQSMAEKNGISAAATAFVSRILVLDPENRPSAKTLLQDPWLSEVP